MIDEVRLNITQTVGITYGIINLTGLNVIATMEVNIMRSDVNPNDTSIDYSQNTVLGLSNSLVFHVLTNTWNMSISM